MAEPTIKVADSEEEVAKMLADFVEKHAASVLGSSSDSDFIIGLSGGSLPKFFATGAKNLKLDWDRVKFIFCDERLVPVDDPESTLGVYKEKLSGIICGDNNFVTVDTINLDDVEKAAQDYEEKLKKLRPGQQPPRFDLLLLGMGPDGHTCSLFPGHALLEETGRFVAPISDSPKPPPNRVTLTYPVLNNASAVVFVSTGEGKKDVLERVLKQKDMQLPATRVRPTNGELLWILDKPAASKL